MEQERIREETKKEERKKRKEVMEDRRKKRRGDRGEKEKREVIEEERKKRRGNRGGKKEKRQWKRKGKRREVKEEDMRREEGRLGKGMGGRSRGEGGAALHPPLCPPFLALPPRHSPGEEKKDETIYKTNNSKEQRENKLSELYEIMNKLFLRTQM
ncbi:hypothetical protein E2C01_040105 [Portunus trituberculatus]|uniref:Uncharacterized protein n=1 Tax=Portunus trituberculatus TaxID=210409 RepID=A0A5B7FPT9_PORTR|nr:hypothetical protein [Portunus trituberculatus]